MPLLNPRRAFFIASYLALTGLTPIHASHFRNSSSSSSSNASNALIPGGKKAGSAGGRAVPFWEDHLGWWYDWTPSPSPDAPGIIPVSMLWGSGNNGDQDAERYQEFKDLTNQPQFILGFNEPDCPGPDSADMSVSDGVTIWNQLIVPWGEKGSHLGSPAMCTQKDESWLKNFEGENLDRDWDFTAIHVYKPDMSGVQQDIDQYWNTYNKPIWVTEFACVYDQDNFTPCSDQGQINQWISDVVDLFENNEHILAYAYTDGNGLGDVWPPTNDDGSALSQSGKAYLDAISKYS